MEAATTATQPAPRKQRYYGTAAAAVRLEVAQVTVRQWCEHKKIPCVKMGNKLWKIPVEWVESRVEQMLAGRGGSLLVEGRR